MPLTWLDSTRDFDESLGSCLASEVYKLAAAGFFCGRDPSNRRHHLQEVRNVLSSSGH
jgi:hypothetical protein